eukprot:587022-Amphidinium_carterae.1
MVLGDLGNFRYCLAWWAYTCKGDCSLCQCKLPDACAWDSQPKGFCCQANFTCVFDSSLPQNTNQESAGKS